MLQRTNEIASNLIVNSLDFRSSYNPRNGVTTFMIMDSINEPPVSVPRKIYVHDFNSNEKEAS
jgi:hypothetical protein